jgi:acetylornithine deacetylase/succinyl-diaminopimelate desuccinylase-like protein
MDVVELARRLISIPSYWDQNASVDEYRLAKFIFEYLQGLGVFSLEKQSVEGRRFNVIAHDGHPPRLLFCCHMDTVLPSGGWKRDPFSGHTEEDRLYGLGACDMKGGIAALLSALQSFQETRGLFLLFDVDEEYYFKGMLKFLEQYDVHPELAVFPEPGAKIGNGHRGLIEVSFQVGGQTAHAARPELGNNAILGVSRGVERLLESLEAYQHTSLGQTTCNLACLKGGIELDNGAIGCRPNQIPDLAEAVLDIRPASPELRAKTVVDFLTEYLESNGFQMRETEERLDFGSLYIPPERLGALEEVVRDVLGSVKYDDISHAGYGEGQLLNERLGVDCVYFGPGPKEMAHQSDEYVSVTELHEAASVYSQLIERYCGQ